MTDVLLATSYTLSLDPKQRRLMKPYPPLATILAAAVLRDAGYSVALYDGMFEAGLGAFERALNEHQPKVVALYEDSFNWLAKMCLSNMRDAALTMAKMAKDRGALVLASGPDATDDPRVYLEGGVDQVIVGEAEMTLLERVHAHRDGRRGDVDTMAGLVVLDGEAEDGVRRNPARPIIADLDALPLPAWDLINVEAYRSAWKARHGFFSLNQITTRGCPFKCNWCAKPVYGDRYQTRGPERVVEELAMVVERYNPDHIWFADDILGLKKNWLLEFSDRVAAAKLARPFMCQTRVDLMTASNVAAMARAGCEEVWMGAESGSTEVLSSMEKGITPEQTRAAVERLKAAGIKVALFLQFGYPGEGWEQIGQTRAMVAACLPDELGISVSYPLPGTRFYDAVSAQLGTKTNWAHSDDLDPLFPGAFSRDFYRVLHRMVHHEHRSRLGVDILRKALKDPTAVDKKKARQVASMARHLPGFVKDRALVEVLKWREGGGHPMPITVERGA